MSNQAGWAEMEITPPLGLPMGGRGPRFTPGAQILDPLMAQAVLLEDQNGKRQLWLSLDLIGMDHARAARLRQRLSALSGAPYPAVVINFAHVHSGPMTNFHKYPTLISEPPLLSRYYDALVEALDSLVVQALTKLQPVTIRVHRGASHIGINRRRADSGRIIMAPNPAGVYNPDLWVLDIQSQIGDERAVLFSYGCHPVIAYSFAWDGVSADFPGATRQALRRQLGPHVQGQFIQGLAGDVRPRALADTTTRAFRKSSPEDLQRVSDELARDVIAALGSPADPLTLALDAVSDWVHPRRDLERMPSLDFWRAMAEQEDELSRNVGRYWAQVVSSGRPMPSILPMEIGLLQLAPGHRIAWFNGEAVAEWLSLLRGWLDDPHLVAWGYCQEVSTYLPTDALLLEGGYEVINANWYDELGPAPFAAGIDETFRQGFEALAQRLAIR